MEDTPLSREGVNRVALRLFEHNEKAYHAAVRMMEQYGKAAIVHPTGTGKSYIAFKLIEDNPKKVVLWLSPSEYIFKTQLESLKRNDPEFPLANVHFYTYAKLMCCTQAQLEKIAAQKPAYIILDEFHRAGAECWGESAVALLKLCPDAKLLGLTATNIRYLDNNRDMAEELFDSRVASDMTLGEAVVRGILPAPKYVTTVYQYQKALAKYQARVDNLRTPGIQDVNQKYLDALRRALEQADGLDRVFAHHITNRSGKYIVFCANKEHMDEMVSHVPEWFAGVNTDVVVYEAYSDDPNTDKAFANFKTDTSNRLKLLFCIDMLNEGVHVEGISGVILFRPTISPIIYKQQIGRALTAGDTATPLILDVVNNFEGLTSISGLQSEMQEAVHRLYANGEGDKIVTERFEVIEQVHDCRVLFEQLQASLSSSWEHYFSEASIYYVEHGNLNVPKLYTTPGGLSLGVWLVTQRRVREGQIQGNLTEQQIARLDSIGMVWGNRKEIAWQHGFEAAKKYHDTYGNLMVPGKYTDPDGYPLGQWIIKTRQQKLNGRLKEERITQLEEIGMVWSVFDAKWEKAYALAAAYYEENGNLNIPRSYVTAAGERLGQWVASQQWAYPKGKLTDEQVERLNRIGMYWGNRNDRQWNEGYQEAKRYFDAHGDLNVPADYVSSGGYNLGNWVKRQRYTRQNPEKSCAVLTEERIGKLDAIGIVLLQNPFHYKQLTREKVLRKLKEVKKVKFISLVHDVEELRRFRYDDYYKSEFESMLALVDVLIVHNDRMAEFFRQRGVPEEKLVLLHIFDYLQDHEPATAPAFEKKITVAGNLDTKKCAYIKELSRLHDVEVQLYGSNFDPAMKDCAHIHYGGSFPPDEIPSKLTGGFGLVWDGTSIDGCQGDAGQYLRYNNPHKLSLYLSSGLPVVIWSGAAEADLVKKYNVGITVDSLLKLPDQMAQLTEGDYNTMRNNTKTLAQKLKHGYYAEQALKKALCIIKKNETI